MAAVGFMAHPARDAFQGYPQQYAMYPSRPQQASSEVVSSLHVNPYACYAPPSQHQQQQQQQALARSTTQSSESRSSEDGNRPSLPSISNLLGIADGDRPTQEDEAKVQQAAQPPRQQSNQSYTEQPRYRTVSTAHELSSSMRTAIPPTPPLRNDSVIDHTQSPSTISTGSSISAQPYFMGSALNNMDAEQQRVAQVNFMKRHSIPSQPNTSPYGTSPYNTSPYANSPGGVSNGSYYSPTDGSYAASQLYPQRPLPSNFPPPPGPVQLASTIPTTNPWEHHHYISPSSQATFPQSQDRYICQTCNKAFSRPSSLKIHSHSHTGEKPFKCPHAGCGKAFSVRSNMKRHERGCHTGASGLAAHLT